MKTLPIFFSVSLLLPTIQAAETRNVDVCVYGATPSGIMAALAVQREGKSVLLVEPSRWVGGILGAGIKPKQDCPNPAAVGGMTRPLLDSLGNDPKTIRDSFQKLLDDHKIEVIYEHRVSECVKDGTELETAVFDTAPYDALGCPPAEATEKAFLTVKAKVFIDAGYEGDLMDRAGVSNRVGRESIEEFDEENAGVREPLELTPIDPFIIPGDPKSGLLPGVTGANDIPVGSADEHTQAYNYRYYVTSDPEQRAAITAPDGYDPKQFELVGRYVDFLKGKYPDEKELTKHLSRIFPGWMNGGEYNYHRNSLITMAPVGVSHLYAKGDYAEKARTWKIHQDYLRGLHEFMSTDPRVPAAFRKQTAALGLELKHHPDTGGWPHQLYARVSRRMEGRYTVTAHDVYNRGEKVKDPVALAQYGIDVYPCRRVWLEKDGETMVGLEGWMFVGGSKGPTQTPYPIPYRSITPKAEECSNLLVSICFSASHLGYASARMEPVFMICGEASGIAACRSLSESTTVQEIDMATYRAALDKAAMVLEWDAAAHLRTGSVISVDEVFSTGDTDADKLLSRAEWDAIKKGWEWLFDATDVNADGNLDRAEYAALQTYKAKHGDWQKRLKTGEKPGK